MNIAKLGLKDHIEMLPKLYIGDDWDSGYIASWSLKALNISEKTTIQETVKARLNLNCLLIDYGQNYFEEKRKRLRD